MITTSPIQEGHRSANKLLRTLGYTTRPAEGHNPFKASGGKDILRDGEVVARDLCSYNCLAWLHSTGQVVFPSESSQRLNDYVEQCVKSWENNDE